MPLPIAERGRLTDSRCVRAGVGLLLGCGIFSLVGWARMASAGGGLPASGAFQTAMRQRQMLEAKPRSERTEREYERAEESFRAVYRTEPRSAQADASMEAVAELLAEQGRLLHDARASRKAIGEYELLRRTHPASRFRFGALLAEGSIYRVDLGDNRAATVVYRDFLAHYPGSPLAGEVRRELGRARAESVPAPAVVPGSQASSFHRRAASQGTAAAAPAYGNSPRLGAQGPDGSSIPRIPPSALVSGSGTTGSGYLGEAAATRAGARIEAQESARLRAPANGSAHPYGSAQASAVRSAGGARGTLIERDIGPAPLPAATAEDGPATAPPAQTGSLVAATQLALHQSLRERRLPMVMGVRHWSTSVYTRVAIDVQGEDVRYEASRVPNPDRIFFDLHGARLSPELIGKAITVTDGGYLKRIRAAQFSNDVVRVVLDVSDVSEYSAFLLPNPERLIIDIHGRAGGAPSATALAANPRQEEAATAGPAEAPAASRPFTSAASSPRARGIQPTLASQSTMGKTPAAAPNRSGRMGRTGPASSDALGEIATLDRQPTAIRATRQPTSAPVAASVADTTPAPQPGSVLAPAPDLTTRRARSAGSPGAAPRAHGVTPADFPAPAFHAAEPAEIRAASPTAAGERSMVRTLGLKIGRIVIDAGHGGHDSGTLGPGGIEEKDVVLDVALRLGRLLKQRLGADVIYTRDDDTFIPLETRTAIANKAQADLFISVHANSSPDASARGVETYYLNFTTSADALEVAARENAVSDESIHQLSDLVKKITLQDKIAESREFAGDVEQSLYSGLEAGNPGLKDRGVKKAPFVVLIGANMPSILAEISFLTNPDDAHQLRDPEYRERIAESLYRGVAKYIGSLSGVRLAENGPRPAGQ